MVPPFYNFDSGPKLQFTRAWPLSSEFVPNLMTSCASNENVQTHLIIFNVFIISLETFPNSFDLKQIVELFDPQCDLPLRK
jgi:hypothetical protein